MRLLSLVSLCLSNNISNQHLPAHFLAIRQSKLQLHPKYYSWMPSKRKLNTNKAASQRCSSMKRMATSEEADEAGQFMHATSSADEARSLTDGVVLSFQMESSPLVIMPWIGYGTYKLGKDVVEDCVLNALEVGYRCIDTAFIYGGETTEKLVGNAIQTAIQKEIIRSRQDVFITTKHWRKYHGYEPTLQCLDLSRKRLGVEYVDLYLMHWPGPAWKTMHRKTEVLQKEGRWHYAADGCSSPEKMVQVRSETWRAMEYALKQGKIRAIGVSNFTVEHLKSLKKSATIWPPAVNQVECHPLYPQTELLEYCRKEGIVVQAYASLGGQDTGKKQWNKIGLEGIQPEETGDKNASTNDVTTGNEDKLQKKRKPMQKKLRDTVVSLLSCRPVVSLAEELGVTPAQVLLRWALSQNCTIIPKASSKERMEENAKVMLFQLTPEQISGITSQVQESLTRAVEGNDNGDDVSAIGRLCWRNDPLRLLDFD